MQQNMEYQPGPTAAKTSHGIGVFFVKSLIAGAVAFATVSFILESVEERIETSSRAQIKALGAEIQRTLAQKLEEPLRTLADPNSDVSPERKQRIIEGARVVAKKWGPTAREIWVAVSEEVAAKEGQEGQTGAR